VNIPKWLWLYGIGGPILAVVLIATVFLHPEQHKQMLSQEAELASNPSVFIIMAPTEYAQYMVTPGKIVDTWTKPSRDPQSKFELRTAPGGRFTIGDSRAPSMANGQVSAAIVPCSQLHLATYATHPFTYDKVNYTVLLTTAGNAAVCT